MLKKLSQLIARRQSRTKLVAAGMVAFALGVSGSAQALSASQISQVYFFGDSLTDSGWNNLWSFPAPLPTGKAPTFTTFGGYTWAQYIARDLKNFVLPVYPGPNPADLITNNSIYPVPGFGSGTLTGVDYAAGGSTTNAIGFNETWAPSLVQQVEKYFSTTGGKADPNAVYFIWSGANDILGALSSNPTELQLLLIAQTAAINIATEAAQLSARGATRIVVMSMPNLGNTPLIMETAVAEGQPTLPATMKTISFTFNSMLNVALGEVIATYHTKILFIDIYDLLDQVIAATMAGQPIVVQGQSFKFVNATDPACSTVSSSIYCPSTAPQGYVFADVLHPTNESHRIISLEVESKIQSW